MKLIDEIKKIDKMKAKRIAVFLGLKIGEVILGILAIVLTIAIIVAIVLTVLFGVFCIVMHPVSLWLIIPIGLIICMYRAEPEMFHKWFAYNWKLAGKIVKDSK